MPRKTAAPNPQPRSSRNPQLPPRNSQLATRNCPLTTAVLCTIEALERRCMLTADPTDVATVWAHLKPSFKHDLAILEYNNPTFAAALDADLAAYGVAPIPPEPGTLPTPPDTQAPALKRSARRVFRRLRTTLYHVKKPKLHRLDITPPVVTDTNYYYDQPLPNQIAFTFDQDVTASNWNTAITVLDLNTGATLAASGTYSSGLHSVVYSLNASAELPNGNYAAILHGSQITDTTHGLAVVGSDSVPGDDFFTTFFFRASDVNHNRATDIFDLDALLPNYNTSGKTFSQGDTNYDGNVDVFDLDAILADFNTSLPLLTSTDTPTAYIASSSSADIFWDAPSDTLVTQFDLYRNSTLLASGVTDTGYLDTGLSQNTTYNYFVVAKDASGDSAWQSPEAYIAIGAATPTLSLSGDASITEGDTYYLGGSFGDANNDEPTQWNISWGDGTSATYTGFASDTVDADDSIGGPADAMHTYAQGTYTITGSALSDIGTYAANSLVLTVADATPSFSVLGDQTFVQGQPFTINSTFTDFDAQLNWSIAWGDGSTPSSGTGAIPATLTHTYTSGVSAPYTLVANVATADGTYTNTTTVDAAMPSLAVTGSASVQQGATYTLTGSFSDPAGLSATGWTIAWGDGATSTAAGSATSFTHVYTDPLAAGQAYTIAAYAGDANGTYYAAPAGVTVNLTTPSLTLAAIGSTHIVGDSVTLTNSSSSAGGDAIGAWTIAWGDGSSSYADGSATAFAHDYSLPGTFTIAGTASTPHGTYNTSLAVGILDHATLSISAPSGTAGVSYVLNASFSDPGSTEFPASYIISWGDGTSSTFATSTAYDGSFGHLYTTYGTETLSVTASTSQGDDVQTAFASIAAPPAQFTIFNGTTAAEDGVPYTVFVGPPGAAEPQYTIDWGDGTTSTDTNWFTSHDYTYDPNPAHSNQHWATLTSGALTAYHVVQVQSAASVGTLSVSGGAATSVGVLYSVTASFTDPEQHTPWVSGADYVYISWGDGGEDTPFTGGGIPPAATLVASAHQYSKPGTFDVEVDAIYEDDNTSPTLDSPVFQAIARAQVTVHAQPATFAISGPATIGEGDTYTLGTSYNDPFHDQTPKEWTVAWGDGQTTTHEGLSPGLFTHVYEAKGTDQIFATVETETDAYAALTSVDVLGPTVGLSGAGTAYEQGQVGATFSVSRNIANDQPLAVNFTVGGTATPNQDYQLLDSSGTILSGSVVIPAGQTFADVTIRPVDDSTPEWTETVLVTLGTSSGYAIDTTHTTATAEIVDNDLGITLGNGSGNIILQGSSDGTQNLVPLVLNFPQDAKSGAVVTLSGPATLADVWTTPTPDPTDHPILGKDGSTYTASSTSWTYSPSAPTETTFWVGATTGSTAQNDLYFTLSDDDTHAAIPPAHPTSNTATSNKGTALDLAIIMYNDPNSSGDFGKDISNTSHNWLVGQLVDLQAKLLGPVGMVPREGYLWVTPPGNVAHNILEPSDSSSRTVIPLLNDNSYGLVGGQRMSLVGDGIAQTIRTGMQFPDINFFWISVASPGSESPDDDQVSVSMLAAGTIINASTTFELYAPAASASMDQGAPRLLQPFTNATWRVGMLMAGDVRQGVTWNVNVTTPSPFQSGLFRVLQLAKLQSSVTYTDNSTQNPRLYNVWANDNGDPYLTGSGSPFDASNAWHTDIEERSDGDAPTDYLGPKEKSDTAAGTFQPFLMYLPPGQGSQWVPLKSAVWSYSITVNQGPKGMWKISGTPTATVPSLFDDETSEPVWSHIIKNGQIWPPRPNGLPDF